MKHISRPRAVTLAFAVVAGSLLVAAPAAVSAGSGATITRGTQEAFGTCSDPVLLDGYRMTGALEGCWWILTFDPGKSDPDKSHYRATGTERFDGCLNHTVCGTFYTTFEFTAKTDGPWPTSAEIHGRCHHPIDSSRGEGGFAGASGELSFHDVVDVDPPFYPYWGSIHLASSAARSSGAARLSAGTSGTAATTC